MKKLTTLFSACLLLIINMHSIQSNASTPITSEKLWQMQRVSTPTVSPDGQFSAIVVTRYDIDKNAPSSFIYLLNNSNGEMKQLTFNGKDSSPAWKPDGSAIVFVSRRDGGPSQLYLLTLAGGEAQKITDLPVGVYTPKWFPDGKRIAFGANIHPEYNGDWSKLKALQQQQKESKVTAKATENTTYRFWDRWLTDGYFPRLFSVELATQKVTDLMPNTANYFNMMGGVSYDIAPDGQTIAVSMNSTSAPFDYLNNDIYLLETNGSGKMTNITHENQANDVNPVFSNDGKSILYGRQSIHHFYADKVVMTVYNIATKNHIEISSNIDLSCQDWFWASNDKTIYFIAEDDAAQSVFSIPATGGKYQRLFHNGTNRGAALAAGNTLVFSHETLNSPAEIYSLSLARTARLTKLTSFNDELLKGLNLGKTESVTYKGANNADVQMFINYPPDYDPTKKYPLVVMIHGGPHGTFGDTWHYRWNSQLFSAPGYITILPNFHGSTSFGQEFAMSIHGEHANKPFQDVMNAVDYMIEKGLVDPDRMAATGGSYGGFMVSWIAGHTDRFACLVNHAGVYDLHLQFASDYGANRPYQYGGSPWENLERLNSQNPSQFAHNFKSPMLVIHGELDYRVPVAHGFLVYGIYKSMGLDARLVYYPDENHWILSPQNSIYWYEELHNWLERYLKKE
jgi:dipeptidyl aminopeptidase/acylaminoacyl peptidase